MLRPLIALLVILLTMSGMLMTFGVAQYQTSQTSSIAVVNGKLLTGADFNLYNPEGDLVRVQRVGGNVQYIRPFRGGDPYKKNLWTLIAGISGQEATPMNGLGELRRYGACTLQKHWDQKHPNRTYSCDN